jgi:hypothetical protein
MESERGSIGEAMSSVAAVQETISRSESDLQNKTSATKWQFQHHLGQLSSDPAISSDDLRRATETSTSAADSDARSFVASHLQKVLSDFSISIEKIGKATQFNGEVSGKLVSNIVKLQHDLEEFGWYTSSEQRSNALQMQLINGALNEGSVMQRIAALKKEISNMEYLGATHVAKVINALKVLLLGLPQILKTGFADVQKNFTVHSQFLDHRLGDLRSSLADQSMHFDREEAFREMRLIDRLRYLQQTVMAQDRRLKSVLEKEASNSLIVDRDILKPIEEFMHALRDFANRRHNEGASSVVGDFERILGKLVDSSNSSLSDAAMSLQAQTAAAVLGSAAKIRASSNNFSGLYPVEDVVDASLHTQQTLTNKLRKIAQGLPSLVELIRADIVNTGDTMEHRVNSVATKLIGGTSKMVNSISSSLSKIWDLSLLAGNDLTSISSRIDQVMDATKKSITYRDIENPYFGAAILEKTVLEESNREKKFEDEFKLNISKIHKILTDY